MKIAFIGTGLMGAPMCSNVVNAGWGVTAWNRSRSKTKPLQALGVEIAETPIAAVHGASIIISMLSDGPVTASIQAQKLLRQALQPGALWIEMASIKPEEARAQAEDLATLGLGHLDAPVSGGTTGAEAGTLAIMVGGAQERFDAAYPVLQSMGRPVLVGPSGTGQLAKLANQAIVSLAIGAVAEAILLIKAGGGDVGSVRRALQGGYADSAILQQHGARMELQNFVPGGPSKFQLKDLDNVLAEASTLGVSLPMTEQIQERFVRLVTEFDGGEKDHSALFLELLSRNPQISV